MQWEKVKPKGRCQCHASSDGEAQSPNHLFHGGAPLLVVLRLSGQGKQIRDRHHVLEGLRQPIEGSAPGAAQAFGLLR
jgi:hypothetical protein